MKFYVRFINILFFFPGLRADLVACQREVEEGRVKVRRLEADLASASASASLNAASSASEAAQRIAQLSGRVAELEVQLDEAGREKETLSAQLAALERERSEERTIVQEALDDALGERDELIERAAQLEEREAQLLADLEWKLREVEQANKKRIEEKDRTVKELLGRVAQRDEELVKSKAETEQLRALNIEQQRTLRVNTRDHEQLQVNEKVLKEEVSRLRMLVTEKDRESKTKLEQQREQLACEWEAKLREELLRLRNELQQTHDEERVKTLASQRREYEEQLAVLTARAKNAENQLNREVERLQTNTDRDIFELRRQLDKTDMAYQEQLEAMADKHEKEIGRKNKAITVEKLGRQSRVLVDP